MSVGATRLDISKLINDHEGSPLQSLDDRPDKPRPAINKAGIDLHQRRPHLEAAFCTCGIHDAAHADDGDSTIYQPDDFLQHRFTLDPERASA